MSTLQDSSEITREPVATLPASLRQSILKQLDGHTTIVLDAARRAGLTVTLATLAFLVSCSSPGPTVRPIQTASPTGTLHSVYKQADPYCGGKGDWTIPEGQLSGTGIDCSQPGKLQMRQTSATRYPEIDNTVLPHTAEFNTSSFIASVTIIPPPDNTYGGIIIGAPIDGSLGGMIVLANADGGWIIQDAKHLDHPVASGYQDRTHNPGPIALQVLSKEGTLSAYINGVLVKQVPNAYTSGTVGLIDERSGQAQSEYVGYTDFVVYQTP